MGKSLRVIDQLTVASPCPARWDQMDGDDHARFCHQCSKHVYNFKELTEQQIVDLLASRGDVCGRLYKRADGTLITADCPVGVSRRRRFVRAVATRVAAVLSLTVTAVTFGALKPGGGNVFGSGFSDTAPMRFLTRWAGEQQPTYFVSGLIVMPNQTQGGGGLFGASTSPADPACDPIDPQGK